MRGQRKDARCSSIDDERVKPESYRLVLDQQVRNHRLQVLGVTRLIACIGSGMHSCVQIQIHSGFLDDTPHYSPGTVLRTQVIRAERFLATEQR